MVKITLRKRIKSWFTIWLGHMSRVLCFLFLGGNGDETLCARAYQMELDKRDTFLSRSLTRIMHWYEPHHTKAMWVLYRRSLRHEPPRDE